MPRVTPGLEDLTGMTFGELKVLRRIDDPRPGGHIFYECLCSCGKLYNARSSRLRRGETKSCGHGIGPCGWQRWATGELAAYHRLYAKFLHSVRDGGRTTTLSYDEWFNIVSKPCTYCGGFHEARSKRFKVTTILVCGIDRKNSKLSYEISNCQPCCKICNTMKLHHTEEFFLKYCEKIVNFTKKNKLFPINDLDEIWRIYV